MRCELYTLLDASASANAEISLSAFVDRSADESIRAGSHRRPVGRGSATSLSIFAVEDEELEMFAIVVDRHSPFAIVILAHECVVDVDPRTPFRFGHDPRSEDCRVGI